ncbi:MAG: helix-turn-helix domain-containing protein [Bacteroidales bacterium]|nr:helix-turn-helix domain-containing protein [Bacteroidales bacterium]
MAHIKSEAAYRAALKRIDELLPLTGDEVPDDDPNMLEMDMLCDMVEEYENIHYPIGKPELVDVIKLRMHERNLTQNAIANLLGISPSRMSELMHGKMEPSYQLSRNLCLKLNIEPSVVLGV